MLGDSAPGGEAAADVRQSLTLAVLALREAESHVPLIRFSGPDAALEAMNRAASFLAEFLRAQQQAGPASRAREAEDSAIARRLSQALIALRDRIAEEGRAVAAWRSALADDGVFPDGYSSLAESSPIAARGSLHVDA
jgi:hypothetical protein